MSKELTPLEVSKQLKDFVLEFVKNGLDRRFVRGSFDIIENKLKALEIITSISKQTTHFRLIQRNMGNDKFNYYLAIDNCEYRLKDKEEYDLLKEVLEDDEEED